MTCAAKKPIRVNFDRAQKLAFIRALAIRAARKDHARTAAELANPNHETRRDLRPILDRPTKRAIDR